MELEHFFLTWEPPGCSEGLLRKSSRKAGASPAGKGEMAKSSSAPTGMGFWMGTSGWFGLQQLQEGGKHGEISECLKCGAAVGIQRAKNVGKD